MSATAQNFVYRCDAKYKDEIEKNYISPKEMERCINVAKKYLAKREDADAEKNNG